MSEHVVTEGIAGYWHYHISEPGNTTRGLCGARTMHTSIKIRDWRLPFGEHFAGSWRHILPPSVRL